MIATIEDVTRYVQRGPHQYTHHYTVAVKLAIQRWLLSVWANRRFFTEEEQRSIQYNVASLQQLLDFCQLILMSRDLWEEDND